jgi:hypothetical protein
MKSRTLVALALALAACGCGSNETNFTIRFAEGYSPARHTVSVLGVFKDGQMSGEAWDSIAQRVSPSLGAPRCEAGYVDAPSARDNTPLWAAVDDYTRSNGPTDDLLSELAPAARGDLVLILTVAGRVPEHDKTQLAPEQAGAGMTGGSGRSGMGGGMGGAMRNPGAGSLHSRSSPAGAKDALDLAALLYSVPDKKSVGQVSLEYTGTSLDDALAKFTAKLREALPGASCAGWTWDGKVDVDRIRKLGEP